MHPVQGGLESLRCNLVGLRHPAGVPGRDRRLLSDPPARAPGSSAAAGPCPRFLAAPPNAADLDAVTDGPAGVPAQPRPPHRLGEHGRAGHRRGHQRAPPTRATGGSSATTPGPRQARCTTARCAWSAITSPPPTQAELTAALLVGPGLTCSRSASRPSRTLASARRASSACLTRSTPTAAPPQMAADLPGNRRAVVGPIPRHATSSTPCRHAGRRPTAAATSAPPRSS